ncbi:DUF2971 domain-containing protein [Tabrizicola sp. M-4]|uniref:DUF2971 domain-containing protein n=1 Tax=Tabrizicola sp. M-4 TaxID=3055847 RepID=UPI003DA87339
MRILYHYTTLQTFLSIVESKSIRFSDLSKSNDRAEGKFILQCLAEQLGPMRKSEALKSIILNQLEKIIDLYPHFGFCMTSNGDDLGQWRAYANGGQGVAIGFNVDRLAECVKSSPIGDSTKISTVRYGKDEVTAHTSEILEIVEKIDDSFFLNVERGSSGERLSSPSELFNLFQAIERFSKNCYDIKNGSFLLEDETRITQGMSSTTADFLKFFVRQSRIVPYYQVEIEPECIEHIVVGPEFEGGPHEINRVLSTWSNSMVKTAVFRSGSSARAY